MTSKKLAEHANFQTPDLKVFLDLEHPDRFGQDVSGHETILRANRYRETQAGVEVNAGGINVRAVAAIGDGATHLGSFEWGVGFARLLDRVKRNSGVELSIAIDTRMLPREALATGSGARASADADSGAPGFKTIVSTNAELVGKILDDEFLAGVQDEVYSTRDYAGVEYGIFAMPLFDFAGRQIGVIGGTRSLKDSLASLRRMRWLFLAATGIGVSLVALGVVLLSNLVLLRPLMRLERDLLQLAEGGLQTPLAEPTRRDEFGSVGRSLNRLREKLLEDERIHADAKLALQAKSARSSRSLS
jgi:HAMP domain-containing protein